MKTKLFVGAMLLASSALAREKTVFQVNPQFVQQVTETTALGYGNGRKLIATPDGAVYFSAVSKAPDGSPGVCVIRATRKSSLVQPTFEKVWIENSNGVIVSANMHFASSLAGSTSGPLYVVWSGGDQTALNDVKMAHQLRFAKIATDGTMRVIEAGQPFTVTRFDEAYTPPFRQSQLWQEFPSAFLSKDGKLHVVWEARDRSRLDLNNIPVPGIAYAVRDASGAWSVSGDIKTAPYLDTKNAGAQFRPFMVTDASDTMHVVCYGETQDGRINILYGQLKGGIFSGWAPIATSPNDQRHVSVAIDKQGRLHATWREGGRVGEESFIAYSMRDLEGKWSPSIHVDTPDRNGSTPNITVDDTTAYVVWTGWQEGFENSDNQKNNGFPNDNDTVEGDLEFAYKKFEDDEFSAPGFLVGGVGSYPRVGRIPTKSGSPSRLALIWTLGKECLPRECVQIYFSELER